MAQIPKQQGQQPARRTGAAAPNPPAAPAAPGLPTAPGTPGEPAVPPPAVPTPGEPAVSDVSAASDGPARAGSDAAVAGEGTGTSGPTGATAPTRAGGALAGETAGAGTGGTEAGVPGVPAARGGGRTADAPAHEQPPVPPAVPTSADVARLAGVSRATVSYVLNNTAAMRISEPTRRRVRAAAEELGYVPHAAARSLRAGRSRTVLMPSAGSPPGPLYAAFLHDLQQALGRLDYTVVQHGSVGLRGDEAARTWAELRPVAVLAPTGHGLGPRGVAVLRRSGARAVLTLGPERVEGAHTLLTDHRKIGYCAAAHLLSRGRTRIGMVVPGEAGLDVVSRSLAEGMRRAVAEAGADGAAITELPLSRTEEAAALLAGDWARLGLDAVFTHNDEYAMLLMRALQDEGVSVPSDTAVMGADDLLLGRLLRPRLSTVRVGLPSAWVLADLVDRLVRTPTTRTQVHDLLGATAIQREST